MDRDALEPEAPSSHTDLPPEALPLAPPLTPGTLGMGVPLAQPTRSTPLEDEDADGPVPPAVLWAMKYHRRLRLGHRDDEQIRVALGEGTEAIYVIDDGPNHCMIGRLVGSSPDGCTYCLVANGDIGVYWRYADGDLPLAELFSSTRHPSLCAVYEADQGPSNVVDVERFSHARDIPAEYLPPHPPIEFSDES
jgi:hypothetical protein